MYNFSKIVDILKNKVNSKDRKKYEFAIVFLFLGVIVLVGSKEILNGGSFKSEDSLKVDSSILKVEKNSTQFKENLSEISSLEKKVSESLSKIKGAGQVSLVITYETGEEKIYAYETRSNESRDEKTQKEDLDTESKIAFEEDNDGNKKPVLLKEISPSPKGAIVISQGAGDELVRKSLEDAVSVLLNLPTYKIQVFEGEY